MCFQIFVKKYQNTIVVYLKYLSQARRGNATKRATRILLKRGKPKVVFFAQKIRHLARPQFLGMHAQNLRGNFFSPQTLSEKKALQAAKPLFWMSFEVISKKRSSCRKPQIP